MCEDWTKCEHCKFFDAEKCYCNRMLRSIRIGCPYGEDVVMSNVRPLVRCGECEYWDRGHISCEGLARCNTGEGGFRYRNKDDFCSRGKKIEGSPK